MARGQTRGMLENLNQEITIAGGGLAGLALATALRHREVPVTVLEAGYYPRHRVCGEFISGVSQETLENLKIRTPTGRRPARGPMFRVSRIASGRNPARYPARKYYCAT